MGQLENKSSFFDMIIFEYYASIFSEPEEILLEDAQTAENFAHTTPFLLSILLREKRRKRAAAGKTTKTLLKVDRLAEAKDKKKKKKKKKKK